MAGRRLAAGQRVDETLVERAPAGWCPRAGGPPRGGARRAVPWARRRSAAAWGRACTGTRRTATGWGRNARTSTAPIEQRPGGRRGPPNEVGQLQPAPRPLGDRHRLLGRTHDLRPSDCDSATRTGHPAPHRDGHRDQLGGVRRHPRRVLQPGGQADRARVHRLGRQAPHPGQLRGRQGAGLEPRHREPERAVCDERKHVDADALAAAARPGTPETTANSGVSPTPSRQPGMLVGTRSADRSVTGATP